MRRPGQHCDALQLLVGDEHHHVPGAEPQEGGDEPAPGKAALEWTPLRSPMPCLALRWRHVG